MLKIDAGVEHEGTSNQFFKVVTMDKLRKRTEKVHSIEVKKIFFFLNFFFFFNSGSRRRICEKIRNCRGRIPKKIRRGNQFRVNFFFPSHKIFFFFPSHKIFFFFPSHKKIFFFPS